MDAVLNDFVIRWWLPLLIAPVVIFIGIFKRDGLVQFFRNLDGRIFRKNRYYRYKMIMPGRVFSHIEMFSKKDPQEFMFRNLPYRPTKFIYEDGFDTSYHHIERVTSDDIEGLKGGDGKSAEYLKILGLDIANMFKVKDMTQTIMLILLVVAAGAAAAGAYFGYDNGKAITLVKVGVDQLVTALVKVVAK